MNIPLGTTYSSPIDIGINTVTRNWAGFVKIHLQHSKKDGLAVLRGENAFVLTMDDGEQIIGKGEKDFELITKAKNMRLHLMAKASTTTRPSKYSKLLCGNLLRILSLTKSDVKRDFAFITLTTEESRDNVLSNSLPLRTS